MKTHLSLFLPNLFPKRSTLTIPLTGLKLDAMMILLSRATCVENAPFNTESSLKFFFKGLASGAIPSGALGALARGLIDKSATGWWCQATPVECQIDQKAAYVLGNQHINLTSSEINALATSFKTLFEQDGIRLNALNAQDWFCEVTHHTNVVMNDLSEVVHKNMAFLFPSGPDEVYWRKLLTECQMLVAQNVVNIERVKQQKPLVSSLWFWGLGKLPTTLTTSFNQVATNDGVIQGLAHMANVPVLPFPKRFEAKDFFKRQTLLADMQSVSILSDPLDAHHYSTMLQNYEQNWFSPLLNALKKDEIDKLMIYSNDGREFTVTRKHLKYFWRTIKTFDHFTAIE